MKRFDQKSQQSTVKQLLEQKHAGFAITFEVLCTLAMLFTMLFMTIFVLMVMNGQRFMNTVLTTTAAEASRWGGTETRAYAVNVGGPSLLVSARSQLSSVVPEFDPRIDGGPPYIVNDGDKIWVEIRYSLPSPWASIGKVTGRDRTVDLYSQLRNMSMRIEVHSIMGSGGLLQ